MNVVRQALDRPGRRPLDLTGDGTDQGFSWLLITTGIPPT